MTRLHHASAAVLFALAAACSTDPVTVDPPAGTIDFSAFDRAVERSIAEQGLAGAAAVVVQRDSGIVHLKGYGAFAADRLFLIASASKPLSVGVMMRLADRGTLDLDAPVGRYVGAPWGDAKGGLTLAQMLSNSAGLVGLTDNPAYLPYICQYTPRGTLTDCARSIYRANDAGQTVPPDTRFRYGGGQWQLAGGVAEVASGESWARLVRETYVEPCGTTSLGYTNEFEGAFGAGGTSHYPPTFHGDSAALNRTDNPNIEGGAYITVEDYGKLLLMHLRGGMCGTTRVLSEAAVARMQQDRIGAVYGGTTTSATLQGYGLGWWVDRAHPGEVSSPGFYGAMPWLDARRGVGAFIALEAGGTERDRLWAAVKPVLDSTLDRALLGAGARLP